MFEDVYFLFQARVQPLKSQRFFLWVICLILVVIFFFSTLLSCILEVGALWIKSYKRSIFLETDLSRIPKKP